MDMKTLVAEPPLGEAASGPPDARSARVVAGYELHERLGGGGYGEVWRGTGPGGLAKAVKILHGRLDGAQAEAELGALQKLRDVRHPFLLNIERIEVSESRVVIVTELAEQSLDDRFEQHRRDGIRGVPRDELLAYLKDAADALDFMRQRHGLQHLDVKPGNLLIQSGHVKVGDFGLTKDIAKAEVSIVGGFTPQYAPPELLEGKPHANSDQYSLAIVYQTMLTGSPPFTGRTAAQIAAQHLSSPPDLTPLPACDRPVVSRALSKNPRARFKSCRDFIDELGSGPAGRPQRDSAASSQVEDRELPRNAAIERRRSSAHGQARHCPARPLPPIRLPDRTTYRPTVFLGLGGFGGDVIFDVRRRVARRFGDAPGIPFAFLYLDTDTHAVALARAKEGLSGGDADAVEVPLRTSEQYRRTSGRYLDWMSRRWLFNIPKSGEVEGIRPLGRLAFVDHHQKLRDRLRKVLSAVTGASNPPAQFATGDIDYSALDVVVVASIAGGTGGGFVLDAGYLVRDVLRELGSADSRVFAVLAGGASPDTASHDPARANSLALLAELARYDEQGGGFPGDPACRLPKFPGVPFDCAYLIAGAADRDDATRQAAEYLYRGAATPARAFFEASRQESLRNADGDAFTLRTFAVTTGVATADRQAETDALCRATLAHWLAPDQANDPGTVTSAARALLAEAGLTAGQIVARVTARLDGDLGRVIPQIARAAAIGQTCFADALRAFDLALDPSRRPEPLSRFEADLAEWAERARNMLMARLCERAAHPAAAEIVGDVAAGLAEAERLLAGLLNEVLRERAQVERSLDAAPRAQSAELQGALGHYGTLRVCEVAYRSAHKRIVDLGHDVRNLAPQVSRVRAALIELHQELSATSDTSQPEITARIVASFTAGLQSDKAFRWPGLAGGNLDHFRSGLRTAVARFLEAEAIPAAPDRPRPLLDNVGGHYRDLFVGRAQAAAQTVPEEAAYVRDPDDGPFYCREVEHIQLRDAFAALAAGDEWALAAAERLHVREDVNWPDLR